VPVKKPQIPDIPSYRGEDRNLQVWAERIKTAISHLTKTDFATEKDIHCNAIHINGVKLALTPDTSEGSVLYFNSESSSFLTSGDVSGSSSAEAAPVSVLSESKLTVSAKTASYTASFNDMLLCDGTFTVTMPNIGSGDVGRGVTICNVGTGIITVDGNGSDTFYGETDLECIADGTYSFRASTTSKWVLV